MKYHCFERKKRYCYLCDDPITAENESEEHIIINAIGGHLKSKDLLCIECNNKFGETDDVALANQIPFPTLFDIKRDRKKPPSIIAFRKDDGTEYRINRRLEAKSRVLPPKYGTKEDGKKYAEFRGGKKQAEGLIRRIVKENPNLDPEELNKNIIWEEPQMRLFDVYDGRLQGAEVSRVQCKTAINFFIYSGGDSEYVEDAIKYAQGENIYPERTFHFYPPDSFHEIEANEVSHVLYVHGNPDEGILYCYIEYFNLYQTLVKLNDNYNGPAIKATYAYDVLKRTKLVKEFDLPLTKETYQDLFFSDDVLVKQFISKRDRLYKILRIDYVMNNHSKSF